MAAEPMIIALDGPAGSGKSSTATGLARRLGWLHLDTGAWYRVTALFGGREDVDPADAVALGRLLDRVDRALAASDWPGEEPRRVLVDGEDVTAAIRTPEVSASVSRYSRVPTVRERLNAGFRRLAARTRAPGVVAEGRDITTVTFPDASLRVLLTATPQARARRRAAQLGETDVAGIARDIAERDRRDLAVVDFLTPAAGVVSLDTSELTLGQVIDRIVDMLPADRR
ncbi:MAG: (d)CMP kinase [Pseudoclavibacter caeni]|jgi:CMP/dCMP kinase